MHAEATPRDVLTTAVAELEELTAFIEREAAAGDPAQQVVPARGDVGIYRGGTPAPVWLTIVVLIVFSAIAGLTWYLKRRKRGG